MKLDRTPDHSEDNRYSNNNLRDRDDYIRESNIKLAEVVVRKKLPLARVRIAGEEINRKGIEGIAQITNIDSINRTTDP